MYEPLIVIDERVASTESRVTSTEFWFLTRNSVLRTRYRLLSDALQAFDGGLVVAGELQSGAVFLGRVLLVAHLLVERAEQVVRLEGGRGLDVVVGGQILLQVADGRREVASGAPQQLR